MIPHRTEFLFDIDSVHFFVSVFPLNPENWSDHIDSSMTCMSIYDFKNFTVHFPLVDLVTFTDGNFENLSIATRR